jgi:hypothetical protein
MIFFTRKIHTLGMSTNFHCIMEPMCLSRKLKVFVASIAAPAENGKPAFKGPTASVLQKTAPYLLIAPKVLLMLFATTSFAQLVKPVLQMVLSVQDLNAQLVKCATSMEPM